MKFSSADLLGVGPRGDTRCREAAPGFCVGNTHVAENKKMWNDLAGGEREHLIGKARSAAGFAYAPYSKFRVGAAVLGERGVYLGANVENASSGLALCAERSALAAAVAAGEKNIRAVAVACIDAKPDGPRGALMPCGACRQWIAELAPAAAILVAGQDAEYSIADLLPEPFRLY